MHGIGVPTKLAQVTGLLFVLGRIGLVVHDCPGLIFQERQIDRLGGRRPIRIDIRLIAATNRELESEVAAGFFREDLYYRLNVLSVRTPPVRERRENIPSLARHFVSKYATETGRKVRGITPEAMTILENRAWPGNVRELQNAMERAVVLGVTELVLPGDLPGQKIETAKAEPPSYYDIIYQPKRRLIETAFARGNGDYKEAARILGLHPKAIHRFLQNLDLPHLLRR